MELNKEIFMKLNYFLKVIHFSPLTPFLVTSCPLEKKFSQSETSFGTEEVDCCSGAALLQRN